MKTLLQLTVGFILLNNVLLAGSERKKGGYEQPLQDESISYKEPEVLPARIDLAQRLPGGGGVYTTLTGFYDYQSNGGSCQHIRVDPLTGNIHVVYMAAPDSADPAHPARNVYYAYSIDGGATWDNFNDVQIPGPPARAGFPTIDMGTGILASSAIVANHNGISGQPVISRIYTDSPPGIGFFTELGTPPPFGADEPIWPNVGCASDGSIHMTASPNLTAGGTTWYASLATDLFTWSNWTQYPGVTLVSAGGGRHPVATSAGGRVGLLLNNSNGSSGVYLLESTDNGMTWPSSPDTLYGLNRVAGVDTFASYVHCDIVYDGEEPLVVMDEYDSRIGTPSSPGILFWSPTNPYVKAVKFDSTLYIAEINTPGGIVQRFHNFSVGWPVIGLSGSTIGVAYQVFQAETSAVTGFNYSDIWFTYSNDDGATWSSPENLTNTPFLDERYPSISKWNAEGEFNITYQEDTEPGSHAFADLAPVTRSSLVFYKYQIPTGVDEGGNVTERFRLDQNFPNPFNPATRISFTIPEKSQVELTVSNVLGQRVATLVNDIRDAGNYEATFSGADLPTGVYFYTLSAGEFVSSRKMLLIK